MDDFAERAGTSYGSSSSCERRIALLQDEQLRQHGLRTHTCQHVQAAKVLREEDAREDESWPWLRGPQDALPILLHCSSGAAALCVQ